MKKLKLAVCAVAAGLSLSAYSEMNACDYEFPYDVHIEDKSVEITEKKKQVFKIDAKNRLYVNGDLQELNPKQQKLVTEMGDGYRELVPNIANIAAEAAEIGLKAATMALTALSDSDPESVQPLLTKLDKLSERVKTHINEKHINGTLLSDGELEKEFENEIEAVVEEAVVKLGGKMVANVLSKVFSGDEEEMKDFDFRMEMFEQQMEESIEKEAKVLEVEAEKLCGNIKALDNLESELQKSLPGFAKVDVIKKER